MKEPIKPAPPASLIKKRIIEKTKNNTMVKKTFIAVFIILRI